MNNTPNKQAEKKRFDEHITFYAFRYALGRMTYAVSDVIIYILDNLDLISIKTKELMIKEINSAIDEKRAGMQMDISKWKELAKELQEMK